MIVGALVLAVGVPYAVGREPADPVSRAELDRMRAAAESAAAADEAARPPLVAFLGDSYTAGTGSSGAGYVDPTAVPLGWETVRFAQGGTGYTNPGDNEGESVYADRVVAVVAANPDIVVIQGSTNDYAADPAALTTTAREVYASLRAGLPEARIIAVGPLAPPAADEDSLSRVARALRVAADGEGVPFIDPIAEGWLQPADGLFIEDGYHPNDAGYTAMADRLVGALRPLVS